MEKFADETNIRWLKLVFNLSAPTNRYADEVFKNLVARYNEPSRHYHTMEHILKGIVTHSRVMKEELPKLEFFAWMYHDAFYDTTQSDNEAQSAAVFMKDATLLGFTMDEVDRVTQLILATNPSDEPLSIINDIDLAELGASPEVFDNNTANIRKEYHWVEPEVWKKGRIAVLSQFIHREKLYITQPFADRFTEPAIENLKRAIIKLSNE